MFHVEQFRLPRLYDSPEQLELDGDGCGNPAPADGSVFSGGSAGDPPSDFLPESTLPIIEQYYALLTRWNSTYNLTTIKSPDEFIQLHILDSLAALALLPPAARVCDIGAGAGFPGLPLRIVRPDIVLDLIESRGKKIQFLKECVRSLKVDNAIPIQTRMEDFEPALKYDCIVSRATFSNDNWILSVQHWLSHNGTILLWRSASATQTGFSHASKSASNREPAQPVENFQKLNCSVRRHYYKISPLAYRVIEEWRPLKNMVDQ